jgi:hypothetical protein
MQTFRVTRNEPVFLAELRDLHRLERIRLQTFRVTRNEPVFLAELRDLHRLERIRLWRLEHQVL